MRLPKQVLGAFLVSLLILNILFYPLAKSDAITFISKESEVEMGRDADRQVIAQYGIYQDKSLQIYVDKIGQKLVSQLSDKEFKKYFFKVVDSSEINAFALPGGYIYVTRGILSLLNSEAELAGVLGHEIGHVIFHHGAKAIVRSIGAQILAIGGAIASPKNAGQWIAMSTQLFSTINLGYGREAELESDTQGIVNIYEAGYNPEDISKFLKALRWKEIMSGQGYHSFQATHPDTKERIIKAESLAISLQGRGKKTFDNRDQYLSQLQGMPYGGKKHSKDRKRYKKEYLDIYVVKEGDTFVSIAENEIGDRSRSMEVAILNGKKDRHPLKPGQLVKLVRKGVPNKSLSIKSEPALTNKELSLPFSKLNGR
jgi:predicted Zn-dependent protease